MTLTDSEVGSLKAALNCWEWFGYISTAIVFLGCVGEFVAEFTSLPKSKESRDKLALLSLIVLIVGIAGELLGTVRTSQLSGQITANIEERAADAEQKAGEANKEAARLTKVAEDERVARVQIEEALAPRRLTTEQRTAISSKLSRFSQQPVVAISNPFDVESSVLAAEILSTLKLAKWDTNPIFAIGRNVSSLERAPSIPVTGIFIQAAPDKGSQLAAMALLRELSSNGFDCRIPQKGAVGGFGPKPLVVVDVEARPEGPQGDAKLRADAKKEQQGRTQITTP
jgi:type IV pilus biogenesis protein CpaD/CtpE